ncbi:xanthine dehydrogenase family protein molybdopterin-binding subunit [Parasporobacterium paucivorans]|uniref:CO or xanthine dehydrogenase, Mo-binding subunit n=1 Tax=Parasporobacterium paucivorans DSM 15970 TaxID=1122934 RepID=A0A1M6C5U8_9FIRM|nr:xanthine dehydrogenase family protein molybdopterin-binding subunit [Parasporobacterium paucivorans]SHI56400.1 CO or xanthine dehydrogenase, Mo-binding subunit [Parasporobacterium paucivorans DSM 15970]
MRDISDAVTKKDHYEKVSGTARYIADYDVKDALTGKFLYSDKANARIAAISLPEFPPGYSCTGGNDVPSINEVIIVEKDMPVFPTEYVRYIGEPVLLVTGPDPDVIDELIAAIEVVYEEEPPVYSPEEASEIHFEYGYTKGDADKAFLEADEILEEIFHTGYQEQAYMEPQGVIASYEDGKVTVKGSMQCPYYVFRAVKHTTGLGDDRVRIIQTTTGGAFGGKEDYPSMLACRAAVAAIRLEKPVRIILERAEDMASTPKRHPARLRYRSAVSGGRVTAMEVDVLLDGGAYTTLSAVVLQRSLISAAGAYDIPNLKVSGRVAKTNSVPSGAFRGFGAPQSFFAVEMHMNHIAGKLKEDVLAFKRKHLVRQGSATSTGGIFSDPVILEEMIEKAADMSGYTDKMNLYGKMNGRYRKGIGISVFFHGCGFTGAGERDIIKARVRLDKSPDGRVEILVSNTDMGQGTKTTFSKVVSSALEIPMDDILIENPDTDRVPDSGPTVASRSIMVTGYLLEKAAKRLKAEWKEGERQLVEENYVHHENVPWDMDRFFGDAYPAYSWGVNIIETEVDMATLQPEIKGIWAVFDVGKPIDETVMRGQAEGGLLQGIGYGSMEKMTLKDGRIWQSRFTDYMIPTSKDIVNMKCEFIENAYRFGPSGAKGAGELPLIGGAPAYVASVENAIGRELCSVPATPESIMETLRKGGTE